MLIQVRGVSVHAMSGIELSRVRTEFRLRLPEPINKRPLESSGADIVMQSNAVLEPQMSANVCQASGFTCELPAIDRESISSAEMTSYKRTYRCLSWFTRR